MCSRSAADPRAPARRRHWAGAPRLPPRLARAAGAGPGTSHVEVAPFLPFQEHRPRTAAYICCLRREREIGVCRSATSRNIPLFYKFLSAAIRQAAECHTERDTIKASTFHSQFHPVPSLGARRQLQHEHDDAEQVRGRPRGADARIGGERSAAGHAHQEAAWRGPTRQVKMHIGVIGMQSLAYDALFSLCTQKLLSLYGPKEDMSVHSNQRQRSLDMHCLFVYLAYLYYLYGDDMAHELGNCYGKKTLHARKARLAPV